MNAAERGHSGDLARRLAEAEATIEALLSGQVDAVVDSKSKTPILLFKAQAALRESEERYRRILETASEGIWTIDAECTVTFVNRRLSELLGYDSSELLGRPFLDFVPEACKAKASLRLERSRQGIAEEAEVALARRDGSELWVQSRMSQIRDAAGRYVGTLSMMTDKTGRREAEVALQKSEEQYRQIVEATSDGIIKADVDGRLIFVNRRFAEMLGYEPREMIGVPVYSFMGPHAKAMIEHALDHRRPRVRDAVDISFRHRDGTEISVNLAGTPLRDAQGQDAGSLAVVRDVTEKTRLQAQLMVSDRMASVGTMAAGVAHEINNPLAAVIANLDYIADIAAGTPGGEPSEVCAGGSEAWYREEIREPLADAREAAQRVRCIVRDLKIFSRSPVDEPSGPVDVKAIMESSLRMGWNEIRHRARLVKDYGVVPGVEANEARLGQVFLNLVLNAAQSMDEGRADDNEIRVSTRLDGELVVVEVSDTGAGIPTEILDIFDAFFTTKGGGGGTGLGLAICKRIVTDMGGQLTVRSEVGKGTTFRVALPVARSESDVPSRVEPVVVAGRRGRILVVDDERMVLSSMKRVLSKEHDVVTMIDPRQALALCAGGETFDLILCDLMMPDMTGMDLHRELALVAPEQANRMIFLTGGAFTAKARQFLSETPKEHLEKPFDPANLRAIIRRYLR